MDTLHQYWDKLAHAQRIEEIHVDCAYEPRTPAYHRSLFKRIALIQRIVLVNGHVAFKDGDLILFFRVASPESYITNIAWSRRSGQMVRLRHADASEIRPRG